MLCFILKFVLKKSQKLLIISVKKTSRNSQGAFFFVYLVPLILYVFYSHKIEQKSAFCKIFWKYSWYLRILVKKVAVHFFPCQICHLLCGLSGMKTLAVLLLSVAFAASLHLQGDGEYLEHFSFVPVIQSSYCVFHVKISQIC